MSSAPFLTYLTVFKSRLGISNLVLEVSGLVHQPDAALIRKLRAALERTQEVALDDPANAHVFRYLRDKRLVGREVGGDRRYSKYASLEEDGNRWQVRDAQGDLARSLTVFETDIWLSNPAIPSTIGVPTPENVRETFEFPFQLTLISKSTNTWTAAGQLTAALRSRFNSLLSDPQNPFLLGVEAVSLLRQVVLADGVLLLELLRTIVDSRTTTVSRDALAQEFPAIVDRAVRTIRDGRRAGPVVRAAKEFQDMVHETVARRGRRSKPRTPRLSAAAKESTNGGPGVLEHRVSPRLEWLTEFGFLTKGDSPGDELLPKNGFQYRVSPSLQSLFADLDELSSSETQADEVAIRQWHSNPTWRRFREAIAVQPPDVAAREGYRLMKRRIGPAPLREVAFATSLMEETGATSFSDSIAALIDFAQRTPGATLSGGRYKRTPENIFLSDSALENA